VVRVTNGEHQDLVRFLGERFAEIDGRFAQIDARFAQVDARFAQVDARFAQVDAQFAVVRREIGEQGARLDDFRTVVEAEFTEIKGLLRVGHTDLDRRVRRLEEGW
jgi:septation ring formation regulator EzrA